MNGNPILLQSKDHDDVIKWKHFPHYFLAICAGNSLVTGEFPTQRPVTQSFDVFLDLRLNKLLSTQLWGWWFETLSRPVWRHSNVLCYKNGAEIWWFATIFTFCFLIPVKIKQPFCRNHATRHNSMRPANTYTHQGPDSIKRCHLTSIGNPIVEIRRSYDRLISTMGFPIPVRRHLYIESRPRELGHHWFM